MAGAVVAGAAGRVTTGSAGEVVAAPPGAGNVVGMSDAEGRPDAGAGEEAGPSGPRAGVCSGRNRR